MNLEKVHILPTANTPEVLLNPEGHIKIKGRGLVINKIEIPEQITKWIDAYVDSPPDITNVIIAFEYLNSYITTILVSILLKLLKVNQLNKKIIIDWYFEDGDDDILERGEYISSTYNINFNLCMTDDIENI